LVKSKAKLIDPKTEETKKMLFTELVTLRSDSDSDDN